MVFQGGNVYVSPSMERPGGRRLCGDKRTAVFREGEKSTDQVSIIDNGLVNRDRRYFGIKQIFLMRKSSMTKCPTLLTLIPCSFWIGIDWIGSGLFTTSVSGPFPMGVF
jgi:hypothetical protein